MDSDAKETAPAGDGESFAELLDASALSNELFDPGRVVSARVVAIGDAWIFLDIGGKGEGILDRREMTDEAGKLSVKVGDDLRVWYLQSDDDGIKFTARAGSGPGAWAQLEEAFRSHVPVEGVVSGEVKGGFQVRLGEIRAFCPFSQMELRRIDKAADYVGQQYLFAITEFAESGRNIVLSRRVLLEEEKHREKEALKKKLKEGMTVAGIVTSVRDFGAFVNIGGLEGLIPISEVGWSRTEDIRAALEPGQEVTVVIKGLDWEGDRITLSLRDTTVDPWHGKVAAYAPGSVHTGTVARLAPFGAFVRLAEGVDGLIHISKLGAGKRIRHPREAVREGQTIAVKVESVDEAGKRIALAPAGFDETEDGSRALEEFKTKNQPAAGALGSLGELLKKKLEEKKHGV